MGFESESHQRNSKAVEMKVKSTSTRNALANIDSTYSDRRTKEIEELNQNSRQKFEKRFSKFVFNS